MTKKKTALVAIGSIAAVLAGPAYVYRADLQLALDPEATLGPALEQPGSGSPIRGDGGDFYVLDDLAAHRARRPG